MKVSSTGVDFLDPYDEKVYDSFIKQLKLKGVTRFVMRIEPHSKPISTNQHKLWKVLLDIIKKETGNDLDSIEAALNKTGKEVSELNHEDFNNLLEESFIICKEYFNLTLTIKNNRIEVQTNLDL